MQEKNGKLGAFGSDVTLGAVAKNRSVLWFAFLMFVLSVCVFPAYAKEIEAASCSQEDVQKAVDDAADGDTVLVPAGTCSWSAPVMIVSKAIWLRGSGVGKTVIHNIQKEDEVLIVSAPSGGRLRISDFEINGNRTGQGLRITGAKTWAEFQIDHLKLVEIPGRAIKVHGRLLKGLIYSTEFLDCKKTVDVYALTERDLSWSTELTLGTEHSIVMEDNTIRYENWLPRKTAATMSHGYGARATWRHNTWINNNPNVAFYPLLDAHGNQMKVVGEVPLPKSNPVPVPEPEPPGGKGGSRGTRQLEYYSNIHIDNVGKSVRLAQIRGGTFIAFDNVYKGSGFSHGFQMREEDGTDRFGWLTEYPGYDPHRVWIWNNTVNGEPVGHYYTMGSEEFIVKGLNLFYEPMPEYTPLQYPHPWRQQEVDLSPESPKNLRIGE